MVPVTGRNRTLVISAGLFAIACVPRVVGLNGFLTIDEIKWIEGAGQFTLALSSGDLAQTYWHFFPGITITWVETLILWLGWLLNGGDLATYVASQVADPAHTIGFFRLSGALLTAMFAPGTYLLARRIFGEWAASLAGGLVALDPFLLAHSRIVNGDAGAAGLMFLSLLAFVWLWRGSGLRMAALSGALGGLALLTKLPSPLIVPFIGLLAVGGWWQDRKIGFWVKALWVWGLAAVLVFMLLWPAMWANPVGTLQLMWRDTFEVGEAGEGHDAFYRGGISEDPGWGFYPYAVAFRLTPVVLLGLILLILVFSRSRQRHRLPVLALLVYVLFIYVFSSFSPKKLDRYVMAVFPAFDMLAAVGYAHITHHPRLPASPSWPLGQGAGTSRITHHLKFALWVLIIGVLALAFVVPNYPYYLGYYNPLLGGIARATREVPVGWGEGLEQAAAWLNTQPNARKLRVSAWYSDIFFPYFVGERASFSSNGTSQLMADYVVFYVNQVQRQKPNPALVRYFQAQNAAYTVLVNGTPWAWVYRAPGMQISMPDQARIEGRAELLGLDLPPMPVRAGQSITVRLYFHILGQMPDNETWQVSFINADGQASWWVRGRPLSWTPQTIVGYNVATQLPGDLPPGRYSLQVGLWDEIGGQQVAPFPIPASAAQLWVEKP